MKPNILEKLCCPFDKKDLELSVFSEIDNDVREGLLVCSSCKRYYPIISGIPIMSPDEYREANFEKPFLDKWQHLLPKHLENFRETEHLKIISSS
ncbi:MAG: Trm112 family protein [Cruoricaptor ignavus]|nr:Trm112 family protein [Cruoricaptor ignavus]